MSEKNESVTQTNTPSDESVAQKEIVAMQAKLQELLDEKKKEQAKRVELESKLQSIEEEKLKASNQYKELYESKAKELETLTKQRELENKAFLEHKKLDAFLKEIGGLKKGDYVSLIDTNKLIADESGNINADSVKVYAEQFKQAYPELISVNTINHIGQNAPRTSNSGSLKGKTANELFNLLKKGK
jgi:hypothetical protein